MTHWDAHACLPLHPQADFSPLDRLRDAGVNYVSINVGMDMNPVSQILSVLAAFRANIAAHPGRFRLVSGVSEITQAAADGHMQTVWLLLAAASAGVSTLFMTLADSAQVSFSRFGVPRARIW